MQLRKVQSYFGESQAYISFKIGKLFLAATGAKFFQIISRRLIYICFNSCYDLVKY